MEQGVCKEVLVEVMELVARRAKALPLRRWTKDDLNVLFRVVCGNSLICSYLYCAVSTNCVSYLHGTICQENQKGALTSVIRWHCIIKDCVWGVCQIDEI